jgi:MscS family membrane protein
MNAFLQQLSLFVVCLAVSVPAWGQKSLTQILEPAGGAAKANPAGPVDPLGRQTPNGTLFGFLQAMQAGNYPTAAQYLQMSPARRESQGEAVAQQLKAALDRAFVGNLKSISTNPEGSLQPGMPADREKIGALSLDDTDVDVVLVRVNDPNAGKVWLFSSDTLLKVPEVYELVQARQVETYVPKPLVRMQFLGMSVWMWPALLLAIPVAAALAWVLIQLLFLPRVLWLRRQKAPPLLKDWRSVSKALWLVLAVVVHSVLVSFLRLPLLPRHYYYMAARVVLIVGLAWLMLRVLSRGLERVRIGSIATGRTGTGSLVLLGQRILNVLVVLFAALAILGALGFNMTTALAGLGIGGLAIGFGAQKTIENLFGGVSLLSDEVIRVGETCNFNGVVGMVEDISLRSTRIRTTERTELSIPNGSLATMNIDNLSRRDKFLFNPKIGLRYETTPDQLRYVLAQVRRLLYQHPKVETPTARIRLVGLEQSSLALEIFTYILTRDVAEFTAIREDILLRLMDIVSDAGSGFAFPSQTVYLGQDSGLDQEKATQATEHVRQWREERQLPFPDFAPTQVSEFRDSLPYPAPESAVNSQKR